MKRLVSTPRRLGLPLALSASLLVPAFATPSAFASGMLAQDKLGNTKVQSLMSNYSETSTCHTIDLGIFGQFAVCS